MNKQAPTQIDLVVTGQTSLSYLNCDICGEGGVALHVLVPTAAGAPHQRHTGRPVHVLHVGGVLLDHFHQLLDGAADTPTPHFFKHQHCGREDKTSSVTI